MRFLLVEDNIDLGEAIESKLRGAGHSVQWVRNGEAAIRWAGEGVREGQPAVAVIRVEQVRLADDADGNPLDLSLVTTMYLGDKWEYLFRFPGEQSTSKPTLRAYGHDGLAAGPHRLALPAKHVWVYPAS